MAEPPVEPEPAFTLKEPARLFAAALAIKIEPLDAVAEAPDLTSTAPD
jgi:hypothetical protein